MKNNIKNNIKIKKKIFFLILLISCICSTLLFVERALMHEQVVGNNLNLINYSCTIYENITVMTNGQNRTIQDSNIINNVTYQETNNLINYIIQLNTNNESSISIECIPEQEPIYYVALVKDKILKEVLNDENKI